MGAKIQINNDSVYNFGGFFFCIDHFRKSGLAKVMDNTLGVRSNLAIYSYSEIFESMMAIYLTGGSRIEDAKRLSAQFSEKSQGYRLCSPDTILKTLSDKTEEDTFVPSLHAQPRLHEATSLGRTSYWETPRPRMGRGKVCVFFTQS